MPAEISIPKRRGKAKVKVSTKRAMADVVLEEVKRQGVDVEVALIQSLIPMGLKAVEEKLLREVELLAGKKQAHGKENVRWSKQAGSVYLRDQKVPIEYQRVRNQATNTEVPLEAYQQMREPYRGDRQTMLKLLHGISTRKYGESAELVPEVFGISASNLSRRFKKSTLVQLRALKNRSLKGYDFVCVLIDGKRYAEDGLLVALGITIDGTKVILDIDQSHSENANVIVQLFDRFIERGLRFEEGVLFIVDGSKGIISAIKKRFKEYAFIQRCQWHKQQNVTGYLNDAQKILCKRQLQTAYAQTTYREAKAGLEKLYRELLSVNPQKCVEFHISLILNLLLTTEKRYNMSTNIFATESVQNGRFASYAQRNPKHSISLRGNPFDSLRWNGLDSSFLQKDQSQETNPKEFGTALSSRSISISFFRTDSGVVVCHNYGTETYQQNRNPAIQWIFPGDSGIEPFSGSDNFAQVLETVESAGDSSAGEASRQSASLPLGPAQQTHQPDFRSGFGSNYYLWQTTRRTNWLQSQETGKTALSSAFLLRSASPGILAWNFASRQRCFVYRSHQVPEGVLEQGSCGDYQKPYSLPYGFGILRTNNNSISRRYRLQVCHRGQGISYSQSQSAEVSVSKTQQRLGDGVILREHSSEMGQSAQIHCSPASYPGRPSRSQATDFVQRYPIRLSYFCNQPQDVGLAGLFVLQPQSYHREKQQRIFVRLSFGQNPQQLLESQRGIFSTAAVLCQYSPLVQKALPAQRLLDGYPGYDSHGLFGFASQADQTWQPEHFTSSQRLSLSQRIPAGFAQDSKTAFARKFSFLQVTVQLRSSWTSLKTRFSRIFEVECPYLEFAVR